MQKRAVRAISSFPIFQAFLFRKKFFKVIKHKKSSRESLEQKPGVRFAHWDLEQEIRK